MEVVYEFNRNQKKKSSSPRQKIVRQKLHPDDRCSLTWCTRRSNQFCISRLHLNDLNSMIHDHTSHHNKHGPIKSRKNSSPHHIKVNFESSVWTNVRTYWHVWVCVGEHQFSIIISRFSRISRNIVFLFFPRQLALAFVSFLARILQPSKKNIILFSCFVWTFNEVFFIAAQNLNIFLWLS